MAASTGPRAAPAPAPVPGADRPADGRRVLGDAWRGWQAGRDTSDTEIHAGAGRFIGLTLGLTLLGVAAWHVLLWLAQPRLSALGVTAIALRAAAWAGTIADRLRREADGAPGVRVLGPAPAPIARLRDRFRWHLQVHGSDGSALRALVARGTEGLKTPDGVAWIIDVDPVDMM